MPRHLRPSEPPPRSSLRTGRNPGDRVPQLGWGVKRGCQVGSGPSATLVAMAVREDCRHYSSRSTTDGDAVQRCRLGVNEEAPFACPEGCLFFEPRSLADGGWSR